MKFLKITSLTMVVTLFFWLLAINTTNAQLQFEGLYAEGEGGAAWDADGSGPEPFGNGHGDVYYYIASRDYVDASSTAGAHLVDILSGFPLLQQALTDNGFTPDQLSMKITLCSMGDDIEGIDWFFMNNKGYSNFYPIQPVQCYIELDGQPCIRAMGDYTVYISGVFIQAFESGYLEAFNNSGPDPGPVQNVACAFMNDLDNEEIQISMDVESAAILSGNGRSGGYFDVSAEITKGIPTFPVQGLFADNEGTAGWDANGTGPEPYGNGHGNLVYYAASVDYDGINSSPDACLEHCLDGADGFMNTLLQLQYRGFDVGDLKIKMGLCSLGPDVMGEDWGFESGVEWLNEYNNNFTFLINGEPIVEVLLDTNTMRFISPASMTWSTTTSVGKAYDVSANSSAEAQALAKSLLKDVGSHYLASIISDMRYAGSFSGNGRSGVYYEIVAGELVGIHDKATFIPEGTLSGVWTTDNSPYFIDGHQSIENGQTLTIEPGVEVKVRGPYLFYVQGTLIAEGTADDNIIFTRSNPNLWWDGFDYDGTKASNDSSIFDHCIFEYGYAQGTNSSYNSGGIFAVGFFDKLRILNSTFRYNKADIDGAYPPTGGAIALWESSPFIQNCIFHNNTASDYAGAIFCYNNSSPLISNCLFYDNDANNGGAIAFYENSNGIFINNTISDNSANQGGALYFYDHSNPQFINTILWGNEAATSGNQVYNSALNSKPGFYYCDIEEGQAGFGGQAINGDYLLNIDEDPKFIGDQPFPYALLDGTSPCWNAGTPDTSAWYFPEYLPETCLCGMDRILDNRIDMGAYELLITATNPIPERMDDLAIYPNPSKGQLVITYNLPDNAMVNLKVYSILGQEIAVIQQEKQSAGNYTINTDLSALKSGLYLVKLDAGEVQSITKLIIR